MQIGLLREHLENCNSRLAEITGMAPANLQYQSGESSVDDLFLYGIIGGKDVGKTTLINQLAGSRISIDTNILDEGTKQAVAYCHQDDLKALKTRLGDSESSRVLFARHQREELKNVVLVDFPDFDSRFTAHVEEVKRLSKFMQGMVWVTTPRKYGDNEFINQLITVAQSHDYYFVVLNKVDQISQQARPEEIRHEVYGYLKQECLKNDAPIPDDNRLFLISALQSNQFEFSKLRDRLVRVHSPQEIARAKIKNIHSEFQKNIQRVQRHYRLTDNIQAFERMIDLITKSVREAFSAEYAQTVQSRIISLESMQRRISNQFFAQRVKQLPLLWLIYYPLSGLITAFSGWVSFQQTAAQQSDSVKDLLRFGSTTASMKLTRVVDDLRADHPEWDRQWDQIPTETIDINGQFSRLLQDYEDRITSHMLNNLKPPGIGKKLAIYAPLVWFPFIQPVLVQLMQSDTEWFSISFLWLILVVLLSMFSAGSLLISLLFLVVFYTVWLGVLYSLCVNRVQKEGAEEFSSLWYDEFIPWIYNTISHPLHSVRQQLLAQKVELERIFKEIEIEMQYYFTL